jgi:hypothetical protein
MRQAARLYFEVWMNLPAPWTILFGSQFLSFPISGSTAQGVERLRARIHPSFLHTIGRPGLVGSVSEERVSVRFQRRWFHDNYAPVFVGEFRVVAGRRTLSGSLRLSRFAQIWTAIWFGFLTLFTLFTVGAFLLGATEPGAESGLLILLLMWTAGLGMLYFSWWRGQMARAEIENGLREALSSVAA